MKKTRLAIVGCGDVGGDIGLLSRLNRKIETVACVDPDFDKAKAFAKKHKIKQAFADYDELLEKCSPDFVHLAVPHHLHYSMILKAIDKNVHVFCEKPITNNLESSLELCKKIRNCNVKVGINYQYRYDKACFAMARACHKKELGEIYYVRCNIPWSRKESYFSKSSWHADKEQSGGGTLITQASHFIDVALWAINSQPVCVYGKGLQKKFKDIEVEDLFLGTIETANGCHIQLASSMVCHPEQLPTIEVYGSNGTAIYEGRFFPKVRFIGTKVKKEKPDIWSIHALGASLEAFRRWILNKSTFAIPVTNALEVLAVVDALYRSDESGEVQSVDQTYLSFNE